jgi:3-oxoacyl-[acyl-carrier protein] reductase
MLTGKCIMVTGASRGIGRAIALATARAGANVGINYLNSASKAEELDELIRSESLPEPLLLPFDATDAEAIEKGVEQFVTHFGQLDGWVNNAAINVSGLLPTLTESDISDQLTSALVGPILCCRTIIPHLVRNRGGSIVNIGSIVSRKPDRGQSVYAAAKGGLDSFTKALASEYGRKGIRANCILPGMIDTDMMDAAKEMVGNQLVNRIPLARMGSPRDVAGTAVFLLSDDSAYVTGTSVAVDGGYGL